VPHLGANGGAGRGFLPPGHATTGARRCVRDSRDEERRRTLRAAGAPAAWNRRSPVIRSPAAQPLQATGSSSTAPARRGHLGRRSSPYSLPPSPVNQPQLRRVPESSPLPTQSGETLSPGRPCQP
jgi:hypothetical protein